MPLKVSDGMGAWIDDFKKSDAPQFKGKSAKERRDQAIAAYMSAKKESVDEDSDAVKAFLAKGGKIKKLPPAKAQGYHGKDDPGKDMHGMLDKPDTKKIGTRKKVKSMESVEEAKRTVTIDKPDRLTSLRVSKDKPPFDNAKPMNKDPKDKFGNPIKNRAKHLARAAARKAVGLKDNYQVQQYKDGKKTGPAKSFGGNLKKATAHASKMGGDHRVHKVK